MNQSLVTDKAPAAIGPYSQAIASDSNTTIYVSGQLPINHNTGEFAGSDIVSQTKQSLENIMSILATKKADSSNVVKTTVLLADIKDFEKMNEVYSQYFSEPFPARAAFEVANLPKSALVEIEAVATI